MTLILSYLCHDYAVQVSDRRLVVPKPGGGYATYEEAANKALLWKPMMAFSYTGLARMGRQRGRPTDELLLESFASGVRKGLDVGLQRLCRDASKACREMNLEGHSPSMRQKLRRTSFVGVGYRRSSSGPGLVPTMCLVSNAQSIHEDGWRDRADKEFAVTTMELPPSVENKLRVDGQRLGPGEAKPLVRQLRRARERRAGPTAVARIMANTVRSVASRTELVGRNVMCLYVRRDRIRDSHSQIAGGMFPLYPRFGEDASFFRVPRDGGEPDFTYFPGSLEDLTYFGPNGILGDMMWKGPEARVLTQGEVGPPEVSFSIEARLIGP